MNTNKINKSNPATVTCQGLTTGLQSPHYNPVSWHIPELLIAIGAVLFACTASAQSQPWLTVDDIYPRAEATAITSDTMGNIFASGYVRDPATGQHAVVMKSSDGGTTWETSADVPPVNVPALFGAMASASVSGGENHVIAAGLTRRLNNSIGILSCQWLIIRSRNAGATWETVDEYMHPAYSQMSVSTAPRGAAIDSSGTVFIAGAAEENVVTIKGKSATTKLVNHWLIRKGVPAADGSLQWTTTDIAFPTSKESQRANVLPTGVICTGSSVYVVGGGGTDGNFWRVMKSSDGGTTWSIADSFRLYSGDAPSLAHGIAADSAGNLYVAGAAMTVTQGISRINWLVRKGSPEGTNWTTVDHFLYPGGNAWARSVTVAPSGDVHVTGNIRSTSDRWFTRQFSVTTGSWSTTDDFAHAVNMNTAGKAVTSDVFGNLYSAGSASDSSGVAQDWLVRRKSVP